jgi:hypothetical protein
MFANVRPLRRMPDAYWLEGGTRPSFNDDVAGESALPHGRDSHSSPASLRSFPASSTLMKRGPFRRMAPCDSSV